jgi:hypothetical protein
MVNKKRFRLDFKIEGEGKSGVSGVEIWATRDPDARNWQMYKKENNKTPPFVVEVAGEGRYGFTLIAHSGVGLSEPPPSPGDQPQIWIEVDETKPVVRLLTVEVGRGADAGNLTIRYSASDKYLTATPITISYAEKPDGPWKPIAENLANDNQYVWRMGDVVPYQFYVRVQAIDRAGNIGLDDTRQPVKVDLAIPKARVIAVDAAPAVSPDEAPPRPGALPDQPSPAGNNSPPAPTIPPKGSR